MLLGAQNDLEKVNNLAYEQIRSFGMSDTLGHVSFPRDDSSDFQVKPYSKHLQQLMDMVRIDTGFSVSSI